MSRGGHSRSAIGWPSARLGVLLLAAVSVLVLGATSAAVGAPPGTVPTTAPAATTGVAAPSASTDPAGAWTLAQAEAAVSASAVARLPGAVAVFDEAAVGAAIGNAPIRIALLPFAPVADRTTMSDQAYDLDVWGTQQGWAMILVQGLEVTANMYEITPSSVADLEPVLAHNDVSDQILTAVRLLQRQASATSTGSAQGSAAGTSTAADAAPPVLPAQSTADPAEVQQIGDALAADRIYNDPGLPQAQTIDSRWENVGAGLTVRAAFLPAVASGQQLTDLIGPLAKRFPNDVVVVMRGRWMEAAGPDLELVDSALLWVYGNYLDPFLSWVVQPTQAVSLLAGQIGLLRTGVVSNQVSPATAPDPVSSASRWLPWLFAGTALLLAGLGGWWAGRRRRKSAVAVESGVRSGILERRKFGARLAGVAGRIIDLDGVARDGKARDEVDAAVERYRVARDVLTDDGDLDVAGDALDSAERHLVSAGRVLDVPPAASPDDVPPAREDGAR